MAHNLDINNGTASFVSARQDAWHQLGITLPDNFTAEEAMQHGQLGGWNLRKTPLTTMIEETGEMIDVPGRFAVVRDNPVIEDRQDVLGVVGNRYEILQNEELTGLLEALVDESGAIYETAGAIKGGRWVFVTMKLPGHIKVGGVDPIDQYIAAVTTHDGSLPTTIMTTPIRIVCQNTLNLAFNGRKNSMKVRHTRGATRMLVQQAREALDFSFNYLEGFQEEAEKLINTELSQMEFEKMMDKEFMPSDDAPEAVHTRAQNRVDDLISLFADFGTQEGIRNTAWAGLNAMTEYYDHHWNVRPGEDTTVAEGRAKKALFDPEFKNHARQLITSYAF